MMQIYFGDNVYSLAPRNGYTTYVNNTAEIHILAENITFQELESVLLVQSNLSNIKIIDNDNIRYINEYTKLKSLSKFYDEDLDNDIWSISIAKKTIEDQVNENTANIEFLAIMSDIEL